MPFKLAGGQVDVSTCADVADVMAKPGGFFEAVAQHADSHVDLDSSHDEEEFESGDVKSTCDGESSSDVDSVTGNGCFHWNLMRLYVSLLSKGCWSSHHLGCCHGLHVLLQVMMWEAPLIIACTYRGNSGQGVTCSPETVQEVQGTEESQAS